VQLNKYLNLTSANWTFFLVCSALYAEESKYWVEGRYKVARQSAQYVDTEIFTLLQNKRCHTRASPDFPAAIIQSKQKGDLQVCHAALERCRKIEAWERKHLSLSLSHNRRRGKVIILMLISRWIITERAPPLPVCFSYFNTATSLCFCMHRVELSKSAGNASITYIKWKESLPRLFVCFQI